MYVFSNSSVNAAVLNSIANFNIQSRITGTVNGISFTDANIVAGSFSITNQCSSETELSIGQVYVGELNITLTGLNIDRYSLYGKRIIPTWGIYVNSAWRSVPLGTFIISEVEVVSLGLRIRAYDNMSLFDVPFTMASLGGQPRALALAACTACGVTLGTNATTFATFPNYNVTLNATQTTDSDGNKSIPEISTYRDVIHYIAQVTCTNATIDRSGKLIFVPYPSTAVASIDTSHRKMGGMTADFETYYDGIIVTDPATKAQTKYTRSNPSGLTMDLGDNPFINTAAIRNAILNALTFRFHPFRMDILNAPLYDLMDCINLPDGIGDGTKLYCITKYTWTYHGSYTLVGAGQDPKLVAVASAAQRSAAQAKYIAAQKVSSDEMDAAIDSATAQITGNNGGYVVLHDSDNDGQPDEFLVMNTPSINTATKVWRFNLSGLGHSNNGYSGTYGLALTADGAIVADRITAGTLNVDVAKAGSLESVNYVPNTQGFSLNLETGEIDLQVTGTVQSIETYYAESLYNSPPQWDYPKAYLFDADGKALYDANGKRLVAKSSWTTTIPTTVTSNYRWMRNLVTYKDGTTQLTSPVPLQDYYGRANLVMQMSTDGDGNPVGIMSGLADYMKFTAGQLEISSPQFTLDRDGNATFAGNLSAASGTFKGELQAATGSFSGSVTATSLTLGSGVTVPYTNVSGTPDLTVYVEQGKQYGQAASATTTGFKVTSAGLLTASNAVIYGSIYATSLTLGTNVTVSSSKVSGLATVATSGSYNDLSNKPTIPSLTGYIYVDGTIGQTPAAGSTGFVVSSAGLLQASNAVIYGSLYSSTGTIGGMTLSNNALYHGTNSMTSTTAGVYLGTGGLRIYGSASNYVNATSAGVLTVKGGSITGSVYKSDDGTTQLDDDGLTLRDAATDALSTKRLRLILQNSQYPSLQFSYRASTSDSWTTKNPIGWWSNASDIYGFGGSFWTLETESGLTCNGVQVIMKGDTNEASVHGTIVTAGRLLIGGNTTAVGTVKTATSTVTSLASGSTKNIASVSLTKGTWVVSAQFSMPVASGESFRLITSITTTSNDYGYTAAYNNQVCVGSVQSIVAVSPTRIIEVTAASQTVYLTANQNSGSSKTLTASRNLIRAVCIA